MQPSARVIADSIGPYSDRLTTMEVVIHRFVLAEFNTHRAFSRNSASSRAIPAHRQMARVREDPALPIVWPREKPGMQGGDALPVQEQHQARSAWLAASEAALAHALELQAIGVHKSVTNRLLEPFMWHTVIVSSTEWQNFFRQRCSALAQPEIREAAEEMRYALEESTPRELTIGQWHLPYIDDQDIRDCHDSGEDPRFVSAARCARVSYRTHDGNRDVQEDVMLYNRLVEASPPHASPLEHVATPSELGIMSGANFSGWTQLRTQVFGRM